MKKVSPSHCESSNISNAGVCHALQKQTNIEQEPFHPKVQRISEAGNSGVQLQVSTGRNLFF